MSLYCPKVGQNATPRQEYIDFCSNNKGCILSLEKDQGNQKLGCHNPFYGQRVILEIIPSIPSAIEPRYSGKDFSGYGVNLFLMYARKYNFAPVVKVSESQGTYFPHNNSISPGVFANVRFYQYATQIIETLNSVTII